jgi:hypothetical protein
VVHRFTRDIADADGTTHTVPDVEYADLTIGMRAGNDPGDVFDVLLVRNQIQLHSSAADLQAALAETVAAHYSNGDHVAVVVDTRDQAGALNAAIRDWLVAAGRLTTRARPAPALVNGSVSATWIATPPQRSRPRCRQP